MKAAKQQIFHEHTLNLPRSCKYGSLILEVEDKNLNVEGDTGVIGRLRATQSKVTIDMASQIWAGPLVETNSIMLVSLEPKQAQIEGILSGVVRCKKLHNIYDFETRSGAKAQPLVFTPDLNQNRDDTLSMQATINKDLKKKKLAKQKKRKGG